MEHCIDEKKVKKEPEWLKLFRGLFKNQSMTQNKSELRIQFSFFLGTLLCYLPPTPPYPTLLITLNAILVASSANFFFYVSPLAGFF